MREGVKRGRRGEKYLVLKHFPARYQSRDEKCVGYGEWVYKMHSSSSPFRRERERERRNFSHKKLKSQGKNKRKKMHNVQIFLGGK